MSVKPLTREQRDNWSRTMAGEGEYVRARYEATVQAVEKRAERLRAFVASLAASNLSTPVTRDARKLLAADDAARGDQ